VVCGPDVRGAHGRVTTMASDGVMEQISILGLLEVLLRRWRVVLGVAAAALLLALAYALLRSPVYTARTALVPSASRSDPRADLLGSRVPAGLAALAIGGNTNQRLVGAIAKSSAVRDSIVGRLATEDGPTERQLGRILQKRTDVSINPDGSVVVEVTARTPELAASIASQFPDLINTIAGRLGREAALRKREFLDAQIETAGEQLGRAEAAMLAFQQSSDVPEVREQAEQTVLAAAELQRGIFELEARVNRLRLMAAPGNPELRALESDLASRRAQLQRLTGGGTTGSVFVPLRSSPELKLTSVRLLRDFTRHEQVYGALTAAMAQTQVEVNDNLPVVSVLDEAVPPTIPSGASTVKLLIVSIVLGLSLGVLIAFLQEFFEGARRDEVNARFFSAWERVRGGRRRMRNGSGPAPQPHGHAGVGT
jgi:tyrosine-protein kinase Etk/Wzc